MAKGVEGETVERNEEDGVYRAIVARLIQFFSSRQRKKGGEDESSYIIHRFCSNDCEKLAVWKRSSVRVVKNGRRR